MPRGWPRTSEWSGGLKTTETGMARTVHASSTPKLKRSRAISDAIIRARKRGYVAPIADQITLPPKDGRCECCGHVPPLGKRGRGTFFGGLHLDHNHKTGGFRGWLCRACNNGIGNLGDDIAGLQVAIAYLTGVGHGKR